MTKQVHKKHDLRHFFRTVFGYVIAPVIEDSANNLSEGNSRMTLPTGPQSTSYFEFHPNRPRC